MLPEKNGFDVCKEVRQFFAKPILMMTASGDEVDEILGLELGADDYITKPFAFIELRARLQAAVRRRAHLAEGIERCGSFSVNHHTYEVSYDTRTVALTVCEYQVVRQLLRQRDRIVSKETLLEDIAGANTYSSANGIEAHIKNLRKKLRLPKKHGVIETVYGIGYRFNTKYT
jgi:two-component system alkaline phosphatase synthesis response regulator PhoP